MSEESARSLTPDSATSTAAITTGSNVMTQRSAGLLKGSIERSVAHTRMKDEDVQKDYSYGESLGEGSFGKVYRAKQTQTGETVAIKEIVKERAGSSGLRQLEREVSIFKKVDHKNIIKLKEVIETPKKMYLVMDLCEGGDLAKLLQKQSHLAESDTKVVMSSLAEAIKYLHQQGIIHRDLKLENILLTEEPEECGNIQIKVSDFGLSTQLNNNSYENMQEQYCGTLSYMAPEMNSTYSYSVDVWAMGIIMYYLLTRYPKDNELNASIAKNGPKFKERQWKNISDQAKDLLTEMLTINPAYRPSSGEVLNHEWFTGKKREHGNVLELMRIFGKEQKEGEDNYEVTDGAIKVLGKISEDDNPATESTSSCDKQEVRKVSEGNTILGASETALRTGQPSAHSKSTKWKVTGSHAHMPTSQGGSKPKSSYDTAGKSSTVATKVTSRNLKLQSSGSSSPVNKLPCEQNSKVATAVKMKRK